MSKLDELLTIAEAFIDPTSIDLCHVELKDLRRRAWVLEHGVGNGWYYQQVGDDPCIVMDGDAHDVCRAETPELAAELVVLLNGYLDLREDLLPYTEVLKPPEEQAQRPAGTTDTYPGLTIKETP